MELKLFNQRGQAALTDSIFFLLIVSSVCTMLFFFLINYGVLVEGNVKSFYSSDFAVDVLKVVTYVNVMRDGSTIENIQSSDGSEYDYLFALIKEDFGSSSLEGDPKFKPRTIKAIKSTISSVVKPFEDSVDFSFWIGQEDKKDFLFLMLTNHECNVVENADGSTRVKDCNINYFYCDPLNKNRLNDEILSQVTGVDSATGLVRLAKTKTDGMDERFTYVMNLDLWVSKAIPILQDLDTNTDMNCTNINDIY